MNLKLRKQYTYSPEKLEYIEVNQSLRDRLKKYLPSILAGAVLCAITLIAVSAYFYSPMESRLLSENNALKTELQLLQNQANAFNEKLTAISLKDDSLYRTILGIDPLPVSIKEAGIGGTQENKDLYNHSHLQLSNKIADDINHMESKLKVIDSSLNMVMTSARKNKNKMNHLPAIMPIYNKDLKATGSGFGMRMHPILGYRRMHEGQDFYATRGTPVYATGNGNIKMAYISKTFGKCIVIDHGFGFETYYAHLIRFNVKKGQKIIRGDTIGFVGNTGLSSGPHLHYEVHKNGKEVNPVYYFYNDLTPEEYTEILRLASRDIASMD